MFMATAMLPVEPLKAWLSVFWNDVSANGFDHLHFLWVRIALFGFPVYRFVVIRDGNNHSVRVIISIIATV